MAYGIQYLIDTDGKSFNLFLDDSSRATNAYIEEIKASPDVFIWDGTLANDDLNLMVDLTGDWTLCWLGDSYSRLFITANDPVRRRHVEMWERKLIDLLPHRTIYRFDEILLESWNTRSDYLFIRDFNLVQEFVQWLPDQEPLHWTKLQ